MVKVKSHKRKGRVVKQHDRKVETSVGMVKSKDTMPGGRYPIRDVDDLRNAIQAIGRSKDPVSTKKWICKRAKDLGATNLIPANWKC